MGFWGGIGRWPKLKSTIKNLSLLLSPREIQRELLFFPCELPYSCENGFKYLIKHITSAIYASISDIRISFIINA